MLFFDFVLSADFPTLYVALSTLSALFLSLLSFSLSALFLLCLCSFYFLCALLLSLYSLSFLSAPFGLSLSVSPFRLSYPFCLRLRGIYKSSVNELVIFFENVHSQKPAYLSKAVGSVTCCE